MPTACCPALVCRQVGMCLLCCIQHKFQPIPVSANAALLPARKPGLLAPALVHALGNTCMCAHAEVKSNAVMRSSDWRWPAASSAPASALATHGLQSLFAAACPSCGKPDPTLKLAQQHPRSAKMPAHPRAHTQTSCANREADICTTPRPTLSAPPHDALVLGLLAHGQLPRLCFQLPLLQLGRILLPLLPQGLVPELLLCQPLLGQAGSLGQDTAGFQDTVLQSGACRRGCELSTPPPTSQACSEMTGQPLLCVAVQESCTRSSIPDRWVVGGVCAR